MIDIKIHIVHPEITKACVDHVLNMLLSGDPLFDLFRSSWKEFRGYHYIFSFSEVTERTSHILLTGSALIRDRRIVEIHAEVKSSFNDLSGMFFIERPAVLAFRRISKSHAAHADTGYV